MTETSSSPSCFFPLYFSLLYPNHNTLNVIMPRIHYFFTDCFSTFAHSIKGEFQSFILFPLCLSPISLFQNSRTDCAVCLHFPCLFSSFIVVLLQAFSALLPKICLCLRIIWIRSSRKLTQPLT